MMGNDQYHAASKKVTEEYKVKPTLWVDVTWGRRECSAEDSGKRRAPNRVVRTNTKPLGDKGVFYRYECIRSSAATKRPFVLMGCNEVL